MKTKVYVIYDSKAEAYMQPFHMHEDAQAMRAFTDTVNGDPNTSVYQHPEDFALFWIGYYDDKTAMFTQDGPLMHIVSGHTVAVREEGVLKKEMDALREEFDMYREEVRDLRIKYNQVDITT